MMPLAQQDRPLLRGQRVDWLTLGSLRDWFPVSISMGESDCADSQQPQVWWRWMGERSLTAAFFQDSLSAQPLAERKVCCTPLSALAGLAGEFDDSVPPTALIFHVSRCGSTLVTQMLAELPGCVALSEPPVLDAFFRLHHSHPMRSGGSPTLQRLLAALGQRRTGQEQHLVLKLDSWHTPWMPFLRQLLPTVPFVFLYRQPDEVLASHRRQRGQHMVPGLLDTSRLLPGLRGLAVADLDGYALRVLSAVYAAALAAADDTGPLSWVNYRRLPDVLWQQLFPLWGMQLDAADLARFRARAGFHSKHAGVRFEGDPAASALTTCLPADPEREKLLRLYAALEQRAKPKQ